MNSTDDSLPGGCSIPQRDRRNQRRVTLGSLVWALSFATVTMGNAKEWWPFGVTLAGVIVTTLVGIATLLAYRRFLKEADELRRQIELEALALAYGIGVVGGMTYWLLVEAGVAPESGFAFIFVAVMVVHSMGILIGCRRYS